MNKLDILNRNMFVEQLLRLIDNISDSKASTCFAIDGAWGCGKSFVLDLLEKELNVIQSEETSTDKYFVIRYNSWKYDYYEEPLVAIVSTMIDAIEKKTKLFPDSKEKREILGMFKATRVALFSIANDFVKRTTGLDFQKAYNIVKTGEKEGAEAYANDHAYDAHFSFNIVLTKLGELLRKITKNCTIVFIVDELDRCIPEYAVKVLERLHHLTENQENIITVIAIDKTQLVSSVRKLFGFENPEKYLEKFINFEVKLDNGSVSERVMDKYADYVALFDREIFPFPDSVEEFLQNIFKNIGIRTQEQIVKKVTIAHKLLFSDKKDYSFMCMELLITVLIYVYDYHAQFEDNPINITSFDRTFMPYGNSPKPNFSDFFKAKFGKICFSQVPGYRDEPTHYLLPNHANLYSAILYTWYWMHKPHPRAVISHTKGDVYETIASNHNELIKFAETIKMIK